MAHEVLRTKVKILFEADESGHRGTSVTVNILISHVCKIKWWSESN